MLLATAWRMKWRASAKLASRLTFADPAVVDTVTVTTGSDRTSSVVVLVDVVYVLVSVLLAHE